MTDHEKEISSLAAEFERCRKILLALGDENRQHLILEMMQMGECGGVRVGAVTEKRTSPGPPSPIISRY